MKPIEVQDVCALLNVFDIPETVHFYCDILGFEVENRSPAYAVENSVEQYHWCMLRSQNARIMLNSAYDEGERPAQRPVLPANPFETWLFLACPDVDAAYARLQAAAVACGPPRRTPYGFRAVSFHDLDGHGITLQWPEAI